MAVDPILRAHPSRARRTGPWSPSALLSALRGSIPRWLARLAGAVVGVLGAVASQRRDDVDEPSHAAERGRALTPGARARRLRVVPPAPGRRVAALGDGARGEEPALPGARELIEEQVGRDATARTAPASCARAGAGACPEPRTGLAGHRLGRRALVRQLPRAGREPRAPRCRRGTAVARPVARAGRCATCSPRGSMEGISCAVCHQVARPGAARRRRRRLRGQPDLDLVRAPARASRMRPEDARGQFGIANSGYLLDPRELLGQRRRPRATRCRTARTAGPAPAARELPRARASSAARATTCACSAPTRSACASAASTSSACATPTPSGRAGATDERAPARRRRAARTAT